MSLIARYCRFVLFFIVLSFLFAACLTTSSEDINQVEKTPPGVGTLRADVIDWAQTVESYIIQLANHGIKRGFTQSLLDKASYTLEIKDGTTVVEGVEAELNDFLDKKVRAAKAIAAKVAEIHDSLLNSEIGPDKFQEMNITKVSDLHSYVDSDLATTLPEMYFNPYYRQMTTVQTSTVKLSNDVPRTDKNMIWTVNYTAELDDIFKSNAQEDPTLRWQYFGSSTGFVRVFPGRQWDRNSASGSYNDYDPRTRPWYMGAVSGPKDIVIVLDCSLSMTGERFTIATAVAKAVLEKLTNEDFVNVICARAGHWNAAGNWVPYETEVLACHADRMVRATSANRYQLLEKIKALNAGGSTELETAFSKAINLLQANPRTGCQSLIVFITDGRDNDGKEVRCGSGNKYGPPCYYDWEKIANLTSRMIKAADPSLRVFSYLVLDNNENLAGKLACNHGGTLTRLDSSENLKSKMFSFFEDFLLRNAKEETSRWTGPYVDAAGLGGLVTYTVPVISNVTGETIGVVGVDATLSQIENLFLRNQWGTVYSFLINNKGETVVHPLLTPTSSAVQDIVFTPISRLEQTGNVPVEFEQVEREMLAGKTGSVRVGQNRKIPGRIGDAATYYYGGLANGQFAFAFNIADTDEELRQSQDPPRRPTVYSVYNALKDYDTSDARSVLGDIYDEIEVKFNTTKFQNLWITNKHSTFSISPRAHCDPEQFLYSEDSPAKTIDAHKWVNSDDTDNSCGYLNSPQKYQRGVRADVLLTQPVEDLWKSRGEDYLEGVKWTYLGMRSGVFRSYPGHPSQRDYDPTKREWYRTAISKPNVTTVTTPSEDASGTGKVLTFSQALFEGIAPRTSDECERLWQPFPGGCPCSSHSECMIGYCYLNEAPSMSGRARCAMERVEGVTSLDMFYDTFHERAMGLMESSDLERSRSCGRSYKCPDENNDKQNCQTRCYLFNEKAQLVLAPDFLGAKPLDTAKFRGVTLDEKEGEVMQDLISEKKLFKRTDALELPHTCILPEQKELGQNPKLVNDYGCFKETTSYSMDLTPFENDTVLTGNASSSCMSGYYYVTALPQTNLFLLVVENLRRSCVPDSGAFNALQHNATCPFEDAITPTDEQKRCPPLRNLQLSCSYTRGLTNFASAKIPSYQLLLLLPSFLISFLSFMFTKIRKFV